MISRQRIILAVRVVLGVFQLISFIKLLNKLSKPYHALNLPFPVSVRQHPDPERRPNFFRSNQGLHIFTRRWLSSEYRGLVILLHGAGEHSGRYEHVGAHLSKAGYHVVALDHQGHGQSEGERVHVQHFKDYVADVLQLISLVLAPEGPLSLPGAGQKHVFLLGHSMGGLIAIQTAMWLHRHPEENRAEQVLQGAQLRGVVLSAAGLKLDPRVVSPFVISAGRLLARLLPKVGVQKIDANAISRDRQVVNDYLCDPLVYAGKMRARWSSEFIAAMQSTLSQANTVTWPLLFIQGEQDLLCDVSGAQEFYDRSVSTDKQLVLVPLGFHEVFNEPEKDQLLRQVIDWLNARSSDSAPPAAPNHNNNNKESNTSHENEQQTPPPPPPPLTTTHTAPHIVVDPPGVQHPKAPPTQHWEDYELLSRSTVSEDSNQQQQQGGKVENKHVTQELGQGSEVPASLVAAATRVLLQGDAFEKARLTSLYVDMWNSRQITAVGQQSEYHVTRPAASTNVTIIPPAQTQQRNKKALIHSIAHAEACAIDLMWDMIARFGSAPPAPNEQLPEEFASEFVRIAGEEAQHFLSWANHLKEMGSHYGELPAHDGLFDAAVASSDDILKRLCLVHLVHEARGLDTYPTALTKLTNSKDESGIKILNNNYSQEITHVAAGVKWFKFVCQRRGLEEVSTFHKLVQENLKGGLKEPFNHTARTAAGMTQEWYMPK